MPGRTSDGDQRRADERVGEAAQHPGTTHARVWLRRAAATCAGVVVLTGFVRLPAAFAAPDAAATGSNAASVSVDSLTPAVPVKGSTLKITGTITNDGSGAITAAHVGVRLGLSGALGSRNAVSGVRASGDYSPYSDGSEISGHTATVSDIPPHVSRAFTLDIPVRALGLKGNGVYDLGVMASGSTKDAGYTHVVGIERTFLPWYDNAGGPKTRTTFLWPLIDRPHMDIRSPGGDEQTPLFRDDDLAAELAPGGRLQQMVSLGKNLPVTWVIDPDLLATVDEMTKPYEVVGHGGDTTHTTNGTGSANAKKWLNELLSAVKGHQVVALPFGDPDIASIAHNGAGVPGTITHLKAATQLATTTVQTVLGTTPRTDFAWPADGAVDPSIVNVAKAGGADKIIARSDSFPDTSQLTYTPTAARPIGGGTTAIVADATLSNGFADRLNTAGQATLAEQGFLAQSLMIYDQAPGNARSIVVAPQRMPSATQAQAMATAISAADSGGWVKPITLGDAATQTADPSATQRVPSARSYPAALRRQQLSTDAFRQIQSVQSSLNSFLVILSRKDRVTAPFDTAIMRSMSTEWRGDKAGGASFRDDIASYLRDLTGYVHILDKQSITLSGRTATIPVTVQNSLTQGVSGLQLRLTSSQSNRLEPGPSQTLSIDGGHSRSLKFRTTARANGKQLVTAQLYTQDGTPYGQAMVFEVNVTSITDTVMLVIACGLLLLVLAGVRMYRQRQRLALVTDEPDDDDSSDEAGAEADTEEARDARAAGDTGNAGAAEVAENGSGEAAGAPRSGAGPGPRVPGQAGDPTPDTSGERADPPAQGEKVDR